MLEVEGRERIQTLATSPIERALTCYIRQDSQRREELTNQQKGWPIVHRFSFSDYGHGNSRISATCPNSLFFKDLQGRIERVKQGNQYYDLTQAERKSINMWNERFDVQNNRQKLCEFPVVGDDPQLLGAFRFQARTYATHLTMELKLAAGTAGKLYVLVITQKDYSKYADAIKHGGIAPLRSVPHDWSRSEFVQVIEIAEGGAQKENKLISRQARFVVPEDEAILDTEESIIAIVWVDIEISMHQYGKVKHNDNGAEGSTMVKDSLTAGQIETVSLGAIEYTGWIAEEKEIVLKFE